MPQPSPKITLGSSQKKTWKIGLQQWMKVMPFIGLGTLGTVIFVVYPLLQGVIISFQDYNIMPGKESPYVGFDNYIGAFTDPTHKFFIALRNTVFNVAATVPVNWFLSVTLAFLINMHFVKNKIVFRTIYYLPIITSWIVVAFLFKFMFASGEHGLVNLILYKYLGVIEQPISWLQNYWTAMIVIWLFHIWKTVGWGVIIYLAALQSVPKSLYESSEIDGASWIQQFRSISLPMLGPVTIFIVINLIKGAFDIFPQVYFLTKGGPMNQTHVLPSLMYTEAFTSFNFGYASAIGVMMGLIIFAATYTHMKKIGQHRFF